MKTEIYFKIALVLLFSSLVGNLIQNSVIVYDQKLILNTEIDILKHQANILEIQNSYMEIISTKLDRISRFKMSDSTVFESAKATGIYSDDQMIAVWVEGRSVDNIYETVWHELAHHNVTLSRKGISMDKFVCDDLEHFCDVNVSDCYNPLVSHK